MSAAAGRAALITAAAVAVLVGCAGRRVHDGVYRSQHGFRVSVPGPMWKVVDGSRAELELRRADAALAASLFHFGIHTIAETKRYLAERGVEVRR